MSVSRRTSVSRRIVAPAAVLAVLLLLGPPAAADTVDLAIYRYCQPGTLCGYPDQEAYDRAVCEAVQEMNLEFEPAGISFRPIVHPVDGTSPADPGDLPPERDKYWKVRGCRDADVDRAARVHWRDHVALADTSQLSLMVTRGWNRCCSGIPRTYKDLDLQHGFYCDAHPGRTQRGIGTLWSHEMGHHWSLGHTHGACRDAADGENPAADADAWVPTGCDLEHNSCDDDGDCADGGDCVPDALPAVEDTPADRCRFESCKARCLNDPDDAACTTSADCDPGEGPCACPKRDEDLQGSTLDDHTWFASLGEERRVLPIADQLSSGSPHKSWCPLRIKDRVNGQTQSSDSLPPTEVTVRNAMSYHGAFCRGPYVVDGDRREAFTQDQLFRIAVVRAFLDPRTPQNLPDVCAGQGGDADHDGICQVQDNCPLVRNTCQTDSDQDGMGDACDCPGAGPNGGDADGDGIPDACDPDRDGDGCYNHEDDHPDDAVLLEEHVTFLGCGPGSITSGVSDVADTDGDGTINCRDPDDDGDGLCDAPGPGCLQVGDPCPEVPGTVCSSVRAGQPCPPVWSICDIDCQTFLLKLVEVSNPDPTREILFEEIYLVNGTFYAAATPGRSAAESALAVVQGAGPAAPSVAGLSAGGTGAPGSLSEAVDSRATLSARAAETAAPRGPVRLEVWQRRGGTTHRVAVVGEYPADALHLDEPSPGALVRLQPTTGRDGRAVLRVGTAPAVAMPSARRAGDRDRDRVPDGLDNCLSAANRSQLDSDGDGFGNACDADLDQDGRVGREDVGRVHRCVGADVAVEVPILEPAVYDGEVLTAEDGPSPREPDPVEAARAAACAVADLDGDGAVSAADHRRARELLGEPPGPSGLDRGATLRRRPLATVCVDPAPVEEARLVLRAPTAASGRQVTVEGELSLPGGAAPAPARDGLTLEVRDAGGAALADLTLPPGEGWVSGSRGRAAVHRYRGRGADRTGARVTVEPGGRVVFRVTTTRLGSRRAAPALPLLARVGFDAGAVATRRCGETDFADAGGCAGDAAKGGIACR